MVSVPMVILILLMVPVSIPNVAGVSNKDYDNAGHHIVRDDDNTKDRDYTIENFEKLV